MIPATRYIIEELIKKDRVEIPGFDLLVPLF